MPSQLLEKSMSKKAAGSTSRGASSKTFHADTSRGLSSKSLQKISDLNPPEVDFFPDHVRKSRFELITDHMRPAFTSLSLSQSDLDIIQQVFQNIDVSSSGSIDIKELEIFLKTDKDPFNRRVLALFDADKSGDLDYFEFVCCVWNFCSLDSENLVRFMFRFYVNENLYEAPAKDQNWASEKKGRKSQMVAAMISTRDLNNIENMYASITPSKDGTYDYIDQDRMTRMIHDVYGKGFENNTQARNILNDLSKESGKFDLSKFRIFMKTHQTLLTPTAMFQQRLRHGIGGEWFWDRHTKLRKGIPESNFVTTINSMRTAQKRYPEDKAGGYSKLPPSQLAGFNEKDKERIQKSIQKERYNYYFSGIHRVGKGLTKGGHVAYEGGKIIIRKIRKLGGIISNKIIPKTVKYIQIPINKITNLFEYYKNRNKYVINSNKQIKPSTTVGKSASQNVSEFSRKSNFSEFSKKSVSQVISESDGRMDLSRNSSKKIEMSPRRNSKIIEINSRKNSRKDSKNVKITSSISFKKSPSFKKPMTAHQVSVISKQDTISEQSGLSEKLTGLEKKIPPPSISVVVGPQPTQFLGKYENFMLSQKKIV